MRKIAVITSFAEFHLLELLIPNIIETINPDQIFISEGKMPLGPENKGFLNQQEFNQKWTYNGEGIVGFDWELTKSLEEKYPNLVKVIPQLYQPNLTATECYIQSISCFEPETGDEIYCVEGDSFLLETDRELIQHEVSKLSIGEGLSVKYVDFLETQFYTEAINIQNPKYRRFAYKFDNWENYQRKMGSGYLTQDYAGLKKIDSFFVRHYCWWRPGKYKELRYELIYRLDPQYWKDFEKGLQRIRFISEKLIKEDLTSLFTSQHIIEYWYDAIKISIRPSRRDEARWAQFIDVDHPKVIGNHENFIK